MKKLLFCFLVSISSCVFANKASLPMNMSYVEVNSNSLSNVACYLRASNNKPFFAMTSIFAANINGSDPNSPGIYFNPNVQAVLNSSQIQALHDKNIKVLITLLGNHENAGWSCMTDANSVKQFANSIVQMVNKYNLDGVDIDDEYSACATNNTSMIMLAGAIKANPQFAGKLLTKALFADASYFSAKYNGHTLAEYLDYGWEMSYDYSDFDARLAVYLSNGMTIQKLMLGGWTQSDYPSATDLGSYTVNKGLSGSMVYDVRSDSQDYLSQMASGESAGDSMITTPNCLQ